MVIMMVIMMATGQEVAIMEGIIAMADTMATVIIMATGDHQDIAVVVPMDVPVQLPVALLQIREETQ